MAFFCWEPAWYIDVTDLTGTGLDEWQIRHQKWPALTMFILEPLGDADLAAGISGAENINFCLACTHELFVFMVSNETLDNVVPV